MRVRKNAKHKLISEGEQRGSGVLTKTMNKHAMTYLLLAWLFSWDYINISSLCVCINSFMFARKEREREITIDRSLLCTSFFHLEISYPNDSWSLETTVIVTCCCDDHVSLNKQMCEPMSINHSVYSRSRRSNIDIHMYSYQSQSHHSDCQLAPWIFYLSPSLSSAISNQDNVLFDVLFLY